MSKLPPVCAACMGLFTDIGWVVYDGGLVVHADNGTCERYARRKGKKPTAWRGGPSQSAREARIQKAQASPADAVSEVIDMVAGYFHIEPAELRGPRRTAMIAYPRHIAMYLSRARAGVTLAEIGAAFGGRDHSAVLYAIDKIEDMGRRNPTRDHLNALRYLLLSTS